MMPGMISNSFIPVAGSVSLHVSISRPSTTFTHPALLLLHFWGGSNATFSPLISELTDTYPIIAPSLRGWGKSSKPTDDDNSAYRIHDHASDIHTLIRHLQSSHSDLLRSGLVLIGHSMGAKVALQVLSILSQKDKDPIKAMILLAPAPPGSFQLPTAEMREQQVRAYDCADSAEFVFSNVLLGRPENASPQMLEGLVIDAIRGSEGAKTSWPTYATKEEVESAGVSGLKAMVVVGELDRVETPTNVHEKVVRFLEERHAQVTVEQIPGVGHLLPVEAPKRLATLVRDFA